MTLTENTDVRFQANIGFCGRRDVLLFVPKRLFTSLAVSFGTVMEVQA